MRGDGINLDDLLTPPRPRPARGQDSRGGRWSVSAISATTSSGPAKDIETAMRAAGFPWVLELRYRWSRALGLGLLTGKANIGTTLGYKATRAATICSWTTASAPGRWCRTSGSVRCGRKPVRHSFAPRRGEATPRLFPRLMGTERRPSSAGWLGSGFRFDRWVLCTSRGGCSTEPWGRPWWGPTSSRRALGFSSRPRDRSRRHRRASATGLRARGEAYTSDRRPLTACHWSLMDDGG